MKFIGNASTYFISNFINKAIPFLLLPILTRYLSPSDYGVVANFYVFLGFAIVLVGLNTNGALMVQYFKIKKVELRTYAGNIIIILFVSFCIWVIVCFLAGKLMEDYFGLSLLWLLLTIATAFSQSFIALLLVLWQAAGKAMLYGSFNILNTLSNVLLSLLLIIFFGWHWDGRIAGIVISTLAFFLVSIYIMHRHNNINISINVSHIKQILCFGIPLLPHALSGIILSGVDKLFVTKMVGLNETGIYAVGSQIGTIIGILGISFNAAWGPYLFKKLQNPTSSIKRQIVCQTYAFCGVIIILAILLSFIAPYLLSVFIGREFQHSVIYISWLSLAYAFSGIYLVFSNYIFFAEKTYLLSIITLLCGLLNVILNYVLIKFNGSIGAAQALCFTYICYVLATWILSHKVYPMPWLLRKQKHEF